MHIKMVFKATADLFMDAATVFRSIFLWYGLL